MRRNETVEQRSPTAADIENTAATDVEAVCEQIEFSSLCIRQRLVGGLPQRTRVHEVLAEPQREEVVREIVVMGDCGRRGTGGAEGRRVDHDYTGDGPPWSAVSS
jgi:hypothetical protein